MGISRIQTDRFWLNLTWTFEMTCFTRKAMFNHFLSACIAVFRKIRKPKDWKISNVNISNTNGPILIKLGLNVWVTQLIKSTIYFVVFNSNHFFRLYWTAIGQAIKSFLNVWGIPQTMAFLPVGNRLVPSRYTRRALLTTTAILGPFLCFPPYTSSSRAP